MSDSSTDYISGFYNVELHHHLYGCIRAQTVRDLAKQFNIPFDQSKFDTSLAQCDSLVKFVTLFSQFIPVLQGNPAAVERLAYECVEDEYQNGVVYFETRFAPLSLVGNANIDGSQTASAHDVINAAIAGLERGEKDFGVKSKVILCNLRGQTSWLEPLTKLLHDYQPHPRVVGIDVAGNENLPWSQQEVELTKNWYKVGSSLGYGCTMHAGEQGMVERIELALDDIKTTRIGHGYAVFKNLDLVDRCKKDNVHFEFCPVSAITLSSLGTHFDSPKNPINLGRKYELNFSLNCDDSLFFGNLDKSIQICQQQLNFSEDELFRIRVNAARAAFLPNDEKNKLVEHIVNRL